MFKFLSVVALVCMTSSVYAFSPVIDASTQNLIRMKLWYEGIETTNANQINASSDIKPLPEELEVALQKFDSE